MPFTLAVSKQRPSWLAALNRRVPAAEAQDLHEAVLDTLRGQCRTDPVVAYLPATASGKAAASPNGVAGLGFHGTAAASAFQPPRRATKGPLPPCLGYCPGIAVLLECGLSR